MDKPARRPSQLPGIALMTVGTVLGAITAGGGGNVWTFTFGMGFLLAGIAWFSRHDKRVAAYGHKED